MAIDKGQPTGLKAKLTGPDTNMITWGFAAKHFSRPRGHYNLFRVVVSLFIFRPPLLDTSRIFCSIYPISLTRRLLVHLANVVHRPTPQSVTARHGP